MVIAPRATAQANNLVATTSTTVTIPATVQTNDVLFLLTANRNATTDPTVADDDSGGNTWARVTGADNTGSGDLWWKRATSATAGKTITISNATTSVSACLIAFSGVLRTGTPYEAASAEANASANESHASITTLGAGRWLLFGVANLNNDNPVTSPDATDPNAITTITIESLNNPTGTTNDAATFLCAAAQGATGATGTITWAQTNGITVSIAVGLIPQDGVEASETVHVSDVGGGRIYRGPRASLFAIDSVTPSLTGGAADLTRSDLAETLHVSEAATVRLTPLLVSLAEMARVSEAPSVTLTPIAISLTETLHISEVAGVSLTPLLVSLSETLHVSEALSVTLTPLLVSVAELLHASDDLTPPSLAAFGDLTRALTAETVIVSDLAVSVLTPLLAAAAETVPVVDSLTPPVLADFGALTTGATETVHVLEAGSLALDAFVVMVGETLLVGDSDPAVLRVDVGDLAASLSEALHVTDIGGGQIALVGRLRVSDDLMPPVLAAFGELACVVTETVQVTEAGALVTLDAVLVSAAETIHVGDSGPAVLRVDVGDLTATLGEALHVSEAATVTLTTLLTNLAETIHIADPTLTITRVLAGDLVVAVPDETFHVADASASFVGLANVEAVVVADAPPLTDLVLVGALQVAATETVYIAEFVAVVMPPLTAVLLTEVIHIDDAVASRVQLSRDEGVHVSDTTLIVERTGAGGDVDLVATLTESLPITEGLDSWAWLDDAAELVRVADSAPAVVRAEPGLVVVVPEETVHVADASASFVGLANVEAVVVADAPPLTDLVLVGALQVAATETVYIAEFVAVVMPPFSAVVLTEIIHVDDAVASTVQLARGEGVHVSDATLIVERTGAAGDITATLSETLHATEGFDSWVWLDDAADVVRVADSAPTVVRVEPDSLAATPPAEVVHLSEATPTARLTPLSLVVTETIHASEAISSIFRFEASDLVTNPSETIHVAETVSPRLASFVLIVSETVHVTETATVVITLAVVTAETLHVVETATPALQLVVVSSEAIHSADSSVDAALAAFGELTRSLTEAVHVSEAVANVRVHVLPLSLTETLHVADTAVTRSLTLAAVVSETIHVAETLALVELVGLPVAWTAAETVAVSDAITQAELTPIEAVAAEALTVTDAVTIYVAGTLLVTLTETVRVTETVYPQHPPVIHGHAMFDTTITGVAIFDDTITGVAIFDDTTTTGTAIFT